MHSSSLSSPPSQPISPTAEYTRRPPLFQLNRSGASLIHSPSATPRKGGLAHLGPSVVGPRSNVHDIVCTRIQ